MPKLTDPGELKIIKEVYGFDDPRFGKEKTEEMDRAEKRNKLLVNHAK